MVTVIKMDKKHKQHLTITIIFALLVSATLFYMYDDFAFQTYGEVVHYDYILTGENEQVGVENVEVYYNNQNLYLGGGRILFKDASLSEGNIPTIKVSLVNNDQQLDYDYTIDSYTSDNLIYPFQEMSKKSKKIKLDDVKQATLSVEVGGSVVSEVRLDVRPLLQLEGTTKEYRIENASVSDSMIRLGSLKASNQDIVKEYPNVSLEYRYLKDEKGSKEDNDNYVVFKKITGESKDLVNSDDYGTYNLEDETVSFIDKDLSVVVIFSNDKDKFAFAIDLVIHEVGDYYG